MRVPAAAGYLSAVRAVAADLALHRDMDLDTVDDLRLAVDEACGILIQLASVNGALNCRFSVGDDAIRFDVAVRTEQREGPDTTGFAWRVLATLADEASTDVSPDGAGYLVGITLVKGGVTTR